MLFVYSVFVSFRSPKNINYVNSDRSIKTTGFVRRQERVVFETVVSVFNNEIRSVFVWSARRILVFEKTNTQPLYPTLDDFRERSFARGTPYSELCSLSRAVNGNRNVSDYTRAYTEIFPYGREVSLGGGTCRQIEIPGHACTSNST